MKEIRIQTGPKETGQRLIISVSLHYRSQLEPWRRKFFCWRATREQMEGERPCLLPSSIPQSLDFLCSSPSGRWLMQEHEKCSRFSSSCNTEQWKSAEWISRPRCPGLAQRLKNKNKNTKTRHFTILRNIWDFHCIKFFKKFVWVFP